MRLAIIISHPIQYYSPWFRYLAKSMEHGVWSVEQGGHARGPKDEGAKALQPMGLTLRPGSLTGWKRGRREDGGLDSLHATSNSQQNALRVFYLWDFGVTEKTDKGFGKAVKWDVDLLEGYDHEFVPNVSSKPGTDWFGGLDNPELLERVKAFAPDAVLQFGYNYKSLLNFDLRWKTRRAPLLFRGDSHLLAEDREQSVQCSVFSFQRERAKGWLRKIGLRFLFKRFACFLAVGKANADYFRAHGVPESKIVRCPHVVDNAFFLERKNASVQFSVGSIQPDLKGRGMREELGIPEDELVFLFAGKLEEKKQPLLLLEAFLAADLPKATLLFVGSGELESALKEKAAEFSHGLTRIDTDGVRAAAPTGLGEIAHAGGPPALAVSPQKEEAPELKGHSRAERTEGEAEDSPKANRQLEELSEAVKLTRIDTDIFSGGDPAGKSSSHQKTENCQLHAANSRGNVVFLEFQNQSRMPDVYRTGSVLVLPSKGRYETWGLAVNEAACCGLPAIVSSHVGCGPDLIEENVTGWIFESGNVLALQRALETAAANRDRLAAMGEALKQRVTREYSYQSATEALLAALNKLKPQRLLATADRRETA